MLKEVLDFQIKQTVVVFVAVVSVVKNFHQCAI